MEFGKLPQIDRVDFSLPPEPASNRTLLSTCPPDLAAPTVYLGATGYNMKAWVGKWYPAHAKERDFLKHYGRQFNTIEHNTTHYRIPEIATVERWTDETPDDFRFCPKAPQIFSHSRDLGLHHPQMSLFQERIRMLNRRLGPCFFQLPPAFGPRDSALLEKLLHVWPKDISLSVEFRHPAWFASENECERWVEMFKSYGISTVITDVAGRRDVCHMRLSSGVVLVRFVGNGLHKSDYSRIEAWAERLAEWFENGLRACYFFTHEPDNILAPELAEFAEKVMSEKIKRVTIRGPRSLPPTGGVQGALF